MKDLALACLIAFGIIFVMMNSKNLFPQKENMEELLLKIDEERSLEESLMISELKILGRNPQEHHLFNGKLFFYEDSKMYCFDHKTITLIPGGEDVEIPKS